MQIAVLVLYTLSLLFIFAYSLVQLHLTRLYRKQPSSHPTPVMPAGDKLPFVTVQLPVYNERYVIRRLIDAAARLDYPSDCFEIQVLDDSNDDTTTRAAERVRYWRARGIQINHIRRKERSGFKAGALGYGLKLARGEYIAIFDADFVPDTAFLNATIPYFNDSETGMIQTRWEHLNSNYSLLTRLQAFGLDAHFSVEQQGRNRGGFFINFNGTAGIWRKKCIEATGGWHSDTLTEDLDLSYRAQMQGWKFRYLETVGSPAELPVTMEALKSQQYRWTKGGAETARKHLFALFRKPMSWSRKLHAAFHLLNSTVFVCVTLLALLSIPVLYIKNTTPAFSPYFYVASFFLTSLLILGYFYWVASHARAQRDRKNNAFWQRFPLFLAISMGISLHNTWAVLQGWFGKKTPFVRTPKFNIRAMTDKWTGNRYLSRKLNPLVLVEAACCLYFVAGIPLAVYWNDYGLLPFHLLLAIGFGLVTWYSVVHALAPARTTSGYALPTEIPG